MPWIIKHANKTYARVTWSSVADDDAAPAYDDYMEAEAAAGAMRAVAVHNMWRTPVGVCSFCHGPTPCLRDD